MKNFKLTCSFILFISISFASLAQDGTLGEVKIFAGNFVPRNYLPCDGQLLPISQNQSLFSILGTIYGGDGRTTFALPNLSGPTSVNQSTSTASSNSTTQTKSLKNGKKIDVSFINKTRNRVDIYWVDWNGKEVFYGNIEAGKTWGVTSGTRQLWRFKNGKTTVSNIVLKEGKKFYDIESASIGGPSQTRPIGQQLKYIICVNGIYPSRN